MRGKTFLQIRNGLAIAAEVFAAESGPKHERLRNRHADSLHASQVVGLEAHRVRTRDLTRRRAAAD